VWQRRFQRDRRRRWRQHTGVHVSEAVQRCRTRRGVFRRLSRRFRGVPAAQQLTDRQEHSEPDRSGDPEHGQRTPTLGHEFDPSAVAGRSEHLPRIKRVSGKRPLREVEITRKQASELRRIVGMRIHSLDPLSEWYPILRFADLDKRERLKGLRLAQELYVADRVLELYLERLTKRTQPDPAYLHANPRVDYVEKRCGRSKDYADPHFLEVILAEYGLNTGLALSSSLRAKLRRRLYRRLRASASVSSCATSASKSGTCEELVTQLARSISFAT
jgi:hypothetical protein